MALEYPRPVIGADYDRRRAVEEEAKAATASTKPAREAHREMARLFRERAQKCDIAHDQDMQ